MNTLGWLFILTGIVIVRQISRGRIFNIAEDLTDAFVAFASGNTNDLTEVLARRGDAAEPTTADLATYNLTAGVTGGLTTATESIAGGIGDAFGELKGGVEGLAMAAIVLGSKAKGYKFTATGPTYYDCSGLMWRAAKAIGYTGPRFTTFDIKTRKDFKEISPPGTQGPGVTAATINDIVLWPTHHMGVITGNDKFYSARSRQSGISEAKISTFRNDKPIYLRYVGPRKSVDPFK